MKMKTRKKRLLLQFFLFFFRECYNFLVNLFHIHIQKEKLCQNLRVSYNLVKKNKKIKKLK